MIFVHHSYESIISFVSWVVGVLLISFDFLEAHPVLIALLTTVVGWNISKRVWQQQKNLEAKACLAKDLLEQGGLIFEALRQASMSIDSQKNRWFNFGAQDPLKFTSRPDCFQWLWHRLQPFFLKARGLGDSTLNNQLEALIKTVKKAMNASSHIALYYPKEEEFLENPIAAEIKFKLCEQFPNYNWLLYLGHEELVTPFDEILIRLAGYLIYSGNHDNTS